MSIQHFYSQTVADGTATSVVRPSDWNSVHNQVLNIGGNTAGTSQISGSDIVWAGGNNVTLSANGSTVTIHGNTTMPLNQVTSPTDDAFMLMGARQLQMQWGSNASNFSTNTSRLGLFELDIAGAFTTPDIAAVHIHQSANDPSAAMELVHLEAVGTVVTPLRIIAGGSSAMVINKPIYYSAGATVPMVLGTSQSNSVANLNANFLQGKVSSEFQSTGAYLTTAAQSNHSHNLATTTTNGSVAVVATTNSAGATIAFPSWLTTAAQSNHSHNFATTTAGGSNIVVGTTNSAGATIGVPAFLTTAALSQNTSNYAGIGTTFAGTNATATLAANTNGVALSLSVAGGGVINQTGPNIAVAGSTVTSGDVYFSNSPTVTFGMAGSTITASAAGGGGGGGATVGGMELFPLGPNTVFSTLGQNTINFQKFIAPIDVSFNNLEFRASGSSVSSTNSQQAAHTYDYGLYERGAGASTSIYNLIASSRMFMQASYNSNTAAGFTVSAGGTSFTSSSAGTAVLSAMTGFKHLYMPFASTITAGGQYAVALRMSSATTGNTSPLRLGIKEQTYYNNLTIGRIGVNEGFSISNASRVGDFGLGIYSATSSNLPATLAISGLTNALSQARLYMQFEA